MHRWEVGSEYHFFIPQTTGAPCALAAAACYGSGRDAMRSVLTYGRMSLGWQRLWLPVYFCQDVVAALTHTGLQIVLYPDGPLDPAPTLDCTALGPGDVVLLMNYFGLRCMPDLIPAMQAAGAYLVEDHSHDPWSVWAQESRADWCVASLRKTLPIPDGGALWSPKGHDLPALPPLSAQRQAASLHKLAAMLLKTLYLTTEYADKQLYRSLSLAGEEQIAEGAISAMPPHTVAMLHTFPVLDWRTVRRSNVNELYAALQDLAWLRCLGGDAPANICPFGGILLFDSETRRNYIRSKLIQAGVYPAVLWPLDNMAPLVTTTPYLDFSQRMLMLHCDVRYTRTDMQQVASLIAQFGNEVAHD